MCQQKCATVSSQAPVRHVRETHTGLGGVREGVDVDAVAENDVRVRVAGGEDNARGVQELDVLVKGHSLLGVCVSRVWVTVFVSLRVWVSVRSVSVCLSLESMEIISKT